jgi:ferritin
MIDPKMEAAINAQINAEMYSAYLYLSMAAYFQSVNLPGFASWMRVQYQEETFHAMKFFDYLMERGGRAELTAIAAPAKEFASPVAIFEETLAHERVVTGLIHKLADLAQSLGDHATSFMLQWFINEQVEEEATAEQVLMELKMIEGNSSAMFLMNRELGARVFTPPAAAAA